MCVLFYFSFICLHVCAYAFKSKVHCGLPYYCTPPVCIPAVIGGLAVWRQTTTKKKRSAHKWCAVKQISSKVPQITGRPWAIICFKADSRKCHMSGGSITTTVTFWIIAHTAEICSLKPHVQKLVLYMCVSSTQNVPCVLSRLSTGPSCLPFPPLKGIKLPVLWTVPYWIERIRPNLYQRKFWSGYVAKPNLLKDFRDHSE